VSECTGPGGRGCACAWHAARKVYARDYARRLRQRQLLEKQRSSRTCQHRHGSGYCGGVLETRTDLNGRTIIHCPLCERRERGICRDCPAPVAGVLRKAVRCARCKEKAREAQTERWRVAHQEEIRERQNERYHANDEQRLRKLEYKRLWRKANPDKVRAAKQRYAKRHGCQKDSRYLEYHRKYNAQTARQEEKRARARAKYYEKHPVRPDPHCETCSEKITWTPGMGRPPRTCDRCCDKYQLAARLKRRAAGEAKRAAAPPAAPAPVKRIRIRHPMPVRYDAQGHRLCLTPGCDIVVTHRKKRCTKCRQREIAQARALIEANHRGRGRRTDMERVA